MIRTELLNDKQKEGVFSTEGPVLILAGAGSGKTRVLTMRTAYLIEEKGINPYNILAITFTNKAAEEMRHRIDDMVGFGSESIWVSTFHSCCVRILRRFADRIGYETNFAIYDTDDQKTVMKQICKKMEIDTKMFKEKMFLNSISNAKNELIDPKQFLLDAGSDFKELKKAQVYAEYQKTLMENNAMDFDDLLMKTVELFQKNEDVLEYYQERFHYIMVDEYQDTNTAQFMMMKLLADKYRNICVVGDDDQSIYKFRGANIRNILDFEQVYPDATVIKLEQNYRSTSQILDVANGVISNNKGRKDKKLWTQKPDGDAVSFQQFDSATEEAYFVVSDIARRVRKGQHHYGDCAILYRTNAQSRLFEERLVSENIPYQIVGGVNFYSRKEIKDLLAYLKTIDNGRDSVAVRRILNVPKRGIGQTTELRIADYAADCEISFYDALVRAGSIPSLGKAVAKIEPFVALIEELRESAKWNPPSRILKQLIEKTGYVAELEAEETEEAQARIENIDELLNKLVDYEEHATEPSLSEFLEEVALVADVDELKDSSDYVVLMTLHGAKGLEFPRVYMVGMEDGLFPSYSGISSGDETDLEEERRLCYVGITRAMDYLTMTAARARMIHGETQFNAVSRFVKEIPEDLLDGYVKRYATEQMPRQDSFQKAKATFLAKPYMKQGKDIFSSVSTNTQLDYEEGDRVSHIKFGEGTVVEIISGGRDFEVTVDFDRFGTKKMFATFAKLKKV